MRATCTAERSTSSRGCVSRRSISGKARFAKLIDELLRSTEHVHILATSREALRVGGEQVWAVPPLGTDETGEAVALFEERARLIRGDFAIDESNSRLVAELCQRLDGIPLAIELAAARLNVLVVAQLVAHLDDRFRLLTAGSRTAERRQQTLQGMMDWSYDLLTEDQRTLLLRLAVFTGGFDLDAAVAVGSNEQLPEFAVIDLLEHLVAASLITYNTEPTPRYGMFETVRHYTHTKLDETGETPEAQERHAHHYATVAEQAYESLSLMHWDESVAEIVERELPNLRQAVEWTYKNDHVDTGLEIAFAIRGYLWHLVRLEESFRLIVDGLEHVRVFTTRTRMQALFRAMDHATRFANDRLIDRYLTLTAELLEDVHEPELRASLLETAALPLMTTDPVQADQSLMEAMELYRAAGNRRWAAVLVNRFDNMFETRDSELADELLEQVDRADEAGLTDEADALIRVGAEVTRARPETALALLERLQLESDLDRLYADMWYADVYLEMGKPEAAAKHLGRALAHRGWDPLIRANLGRADASISLALGDDGRAVRALEPLRTVGRSAYGLSWQVRAALLTARCAVVRSDYARAAVLIGHWDRWARERGFGLTPAAAKLYEADRRATQEALGEPTFEQLAGEGATAEYAELPFYDT